MALKNTFVATAQYNSRALNAISARFVLRSYWSFTNIVSVPLRRAHMTTEVCKTKERHWFRYSPCSIRCFSSLIFVVECLFAESLGERRYSHALDASNSDQFFRAAFDSSRYREKEPEVWRREISGRTKLMRRRNESIICSAILSHTSARNRGSQSVSS